MHNSANVLFSPRDFSIGGSEARPSGIGSTTRYHLYSANGMLYAAAKGSDGAPGAEISISGSSLVIDYGISKYRLYLSEGEFTVKANGNTLLSVTENGLYVNGKKVLTEN